MQRRDALRTLPLRMQFLLPLFVGWFLLPVPEVARAQGDEPTGADVARCVTETGSLLRRAPSAKTWQVVARDEPLHSEELLLFIGADAALESLNRAIRLTGMGEMNDVSPLPVLETAVILHKERGVDLAFTLDRGRVVVSNRKQVGSARARVHIRGRAAEIVLQGPTDAVALEVYSRWAKGAPFVKEQSDAEPALAVVVLALHGEVTLRGTDRQFTLKAPPGPALLFADNLKELDVTPQYLEKLPEWAGKDGGTEEARKRQAAVERFRKMIRTKPLDEVVKEFLHADVAFERRAAVYLMGALDDLEGLARALSQTKDPEVWGAGVVALRHWIGRGPGQDQKLYRALIAKGIMSPVQAETVLTLLHSFSDEELARPETYQMLIDYLASDRLAIRGLAHWHLYRLVPAGRTFGYAPLAPEEERRQAIRKWRQLIPSGQLPPAPRAESK